MQNAYIMKCCTFFVETPITIQDVVNGLNVKKWKSTIQTKLKYLKTNKTWELTILPKGRFQSHPSGF
jgi:hypothetical protein